MIAFRNAALVGLAVLALAGCRDDEDANGDGAPDDSAALNTPPQIAGTPASTAAVGETYTFEPSATDSDGDVLTFRIANRPGWAAFNADSGKLTGTPPANASARYSDIRVSVTDGESIVSLPAFDIAIEGVTSANDAPSISGAPATSAIVGQTYSFSPQASDADGDSLTFSATGLPGWLELDGTSGRLHGTASSEDIGVHSGIVIRVTDGIATSSLPAFSIEVSAGNTNPPTNEAPVISGAPPLTVVAGQTFRFQPEASDADGQALSFTISGKPAWGNFSRATGSLNGTPSVTQVGVYEGITITVSDGIATAVLPPFSVTVLPANSAPRISGTPPSSVTVGTTYNFQPTASDPDGQTLSFRINNKPSWASFSSSTGRLSGTPTSTQAGTYANIVVTVSDGIAEAALGPFAIEVVEENRAPVISGAPPTSATPGALYDFQPSARDPDGDALTFSISNKPGWASFNRTNGRLYGTPSASDSGTFSGVTITVSDGEHSDDLGPFAVTVADAPRGSATLQWSAPTTNEDGTPLTDLRGFRVYYGLQSSSLSDNVAVPSADITSATIEDLAPATWYFAVRAYTSDGTESKRSNVVSKTIN